eukprot:SAG22_NODE_2342_length_2686_cov_3.866641_2_plen_102_part_00
MHGSDSEDEAWGDEEWEGMEAASRGDRIGMLLDLDQGSMTVYKNGVELRVMRAHGLSGPFCWAVSLGKRVGTSARVESTTVPEPSPEASDDVESSVDEEDY